MDFGASPDLPICLLAALVALGSAREIGRIVSRFSSVNPETQANGSIIAVLAYLCLVLGFTFWAIVASHNLGANEARRSNNELYPLKTITAGYVVGIDFTDARLAVYRRRLVGAALTLGKTTARPKNTRYDSHTGQLDFYAGSPLMPTPGDGADAFALFQGIQLGLDFIAKGSQESVPDFSAAYFSPLSEDERNYYHIPLNSGTYKIFCYGLPTSLGCAIQLGPFDNGRVPDSSHPNNPNVTGLADLLGGSIHFNLTAPNVLNPPILLDKVDLNIGPGSLYFVRRADTKHSCNAKQGNISRQGTHSGEYIANFPAKLTDALRLFNHNCFHHGLDIPEAVQGKRPRFALRLPSKTSPQSQVRRTH